MKVLILSTWFPYPQNQGSKIRAYHLIRALARDHELALISFEDQPVRDEWLTHIGQFCQLIKILPEKPFLYPKIKKLIGFFSPLPAAVFAGYNKNMEALVQKTAWDWKPDVVFAFTFVTAPYALRLTGLKRIVDIDNLLAVMLKEDIQFAKNMTQKIRRFLAFKKMANFENKIYSSFDQCLVVSELDIKRVQDYTKIHPNQLIKVPNGVDLEENHPLSFVKEEDRLIYNGALTYFPNLDAMNYFMNEIFPIILRSKPNVKIIITGKTDGVDLEKFSYKEHIIFTGYVDDIRPVVSSSQVCVVPLRQGAGTRLKILEAMALGTAVVSTAKGAEGLEVTDQENIILANTPEAFANAVIFLLNNSKARSNLEQNALKFAGNVYDWEKIEHKFADDLQFIYKSNNE
ncbi:MAG: glycosyltransferase family 4 protein [Anaerolineaceae bacterium]